VIKKIIEPKNDKIIEQFRMLQSKELHGLYAT